MKTDRSAKEWLMFRCILAGVFFVLDYFFFFVLIETMISGNLLSKIVVGCSSIGMVWYSRNIYFDMKREFQNKEITFLGKR